MGDCTTVNIDPKHNYTKQNVTKQNKNDLWIKHKICHGCDIAFAILKKGDKYFIGLTPSS